MTIADKTQIRLIVGMSRGGTTSMMRALNLRGDVAAYGETGFWGIKHSKSDAKIERLEINKIANIYRNTQFHPVGDANGSLPIASKEIADSIGNAVEELPDYSSAAEVFCTMGKAVAEACERDVWVEKTPHHLLHLDRIIGADHNARIVILIRNPYEFLLSYKHQGDRKPDAVRKNFRNLYHPIIASIICRKYVAETINALKKYPENTILVKLEDLKINEKVEVIRVYEHLMLPSVAEPLFPKSNSSFNASKEKPRLTNVEMFWLKIFVGNYAKNLSYNLEGGGIDILGVIGSLLSLFVWPIKNANLLMAMRSKLGAMISRWLIK
ncbi:MAG: sulfotransferase [Hyphomicrobiales bacterium]